ncbi:SRPBCC domain-containing protein [Aggregatimonas sangjinii]|uniref:SRPBCC domain-containing protein n=1 Tax=Aggregatimonas sangjinii TaxID=2583587 RepID=A0A5B7SSJ4_9FLAO|nr:SRPBCC family protein [Aggregatimonas sangjinii]QCX01497.1 SRPBCC domain-containing protein [Aggregatimonas sangjinii]
MKDQNPIIVHQIFDVPVKAVWKAITDNAEMRQWYFDAIPDFRPEVGFKTRFLVQNGERNFTHIWKVKEVVPEKFIGYSWRFEEYSGEAYTIFDLAKEDTKTALTLKSYVIDVFPNDIPEFKRESGQAGWDYLIKESLLQFLST